MAYFLNSLIDMCAIPVILVGLALFGWLLLRTFVWVLERRSEMLFSAQMRREEIEAAALDNQRKATEIEKQRSDLALVMLDPTRPALARSAVQTGQHDAAMLMLAARYLETLQPVQPVPATLHYAPHYGGKATTDAPQVEMKDLIQLPEAKRDFWQLYQAGLLPNKGFLMGYDLENSQPVTATWKDLYSGLIGGQSGSGKSTLIRTLLVQSALQGGRFVVLDKHFGSGEESLAESLHPLRHLMLSGPAVTDNQMIASLRNVSDLATRRLEGKDADRTPLILVVDESTALLQRSGVAEQLISTLGLISQESRKVAVYALCIGQLFNAEVLPSVVRNCFVSFISCRTRKDNARVMSGSNQFAQIAEGLTIGQCVWMAPSGEIAKIAVPNTTQQHIELIAAQMRPNGQNDSPLICLPTPGRQPSNNADYNDSGRAQEGIGKASGRAWIDPETQRIIDLFCGGSSVTEVAKEIFNVDSNGGRAYIEARDKVQETIRDYMKSLGGK